MSRTDGHLHGGEDEWRSRPYDWVRVPVAKQVIADVLAPLTYDMDFIKPWLWASPLSPEHRAVLSIQAYSGGAFELEYGVCCTWVPHTQGKAWRWHRTLKQTRPDLFVSHFTKDAPPAPTISHLFGLAAVHEGAVKARDIVGPRALRWWKSMDTPSGVLTEALRQAATSSTVSHVPHPSVVAAFTMAKLGDAEAAQRQLHSTPWLSEADLAAASQRLAELA